MVYQHLLVMLAQMSFICSFEEPKTYDLKIVSCTLFRSICHLQLWLVHVYQ